ncbi:Annexin A1 [Thelohanellus kitauei]|uniref:Annexin A1 n=1 Tax=Thelohanellus kitauei TaxID=669202 RepID=A0A0C2J4X2_THEKT|nr:Annexin A1 [Thelohanellus kitauei]
MATYASRWSSIDQLVQYENPLEYYNEFEQHPSVARGAPSLKVMSYYHVNTDISSLYNSNFWSFVCLCVRRPGKYRRILTERLLSDPSSVWYSIIKPHLLNITKETRLEYITLNALVRSGAELDAFFLYQAYYRDEKASLFRSCYLDTLREILCTRSYGQILEIRQVYFEIYGMELSECVCSKVKGSLKTFFGNIINMPRCKDGSLGNVDIRLFIDMSIYRQNKDQFIEMFSRLSFMDIRKLCKVFQKRYEKPLDSIFTGLRQSKLRKCAKTMCNYSSDHIGYFAKRLKEYILNDDEFGIIRIIIGRCEIDLHDILLVFKEKYSHLHMKSISKVFSNHLDVYYHIVLPLCGLSYDDSI